MEQIYKLNEYLDIKVKEGKIKENEFLQISDYLKKIANTIGSLNGKIELLGQETKLDLIELLLKEANLELEDFDHESHYLNLGIEQIRKLRSPFDE
tara:strand:+ start:1386 stop:1673 length:288 start_codon:yes stop_codon:yes gene_type:complete